MTPLQANDGFNRRPQFCSQSDVIEWSIRIGVTVVKNLLTQVQRKLAYEV
jgi:hypothetical protein